MLLALLFETTPITPAPGTGAPVPDVGVPPLCPVDVPPVRVVDVVPTRPPGVAFPPGCPTGADV